MARLLSLFALVALLSSCSARADELDSLVQAALDKAGANRSEIETALKEAPHQTADKEDVSQKDAMRFLVAYMPSRDLQNLKAKFLLDNVKFAHLAWRESAWRKAVPKDVFLNNILPYASINEKRDNWREQFLQKFKPLIKDAKSPGEAAAILNQKIFPLLKVKYSTKRRRADQGPFETMETGLASCTGLSILLIDACRAVGVPARFVGTPLWSDKSGNHSWVEVWDDGWHFTGAAEPTGNHLDRAWFLGRASKADRNHKYHAIYAVSYKKTPQPFPMVWARDAEMVSAFNVTDRYTSAAQKLPEGWARIMFQAYEGQGNRCCAAVKIKDKDGKVVFEGKTNDERFDRNDHVTAKLKVGQEYQVEIGDKDNKVAKTIQADKDGKLISVDLKPQAAKK